MNSMAKLAAVATVVLVCVSGVQAQVVIETVPVGHAGNAGEGSGESYGGYGPDAIVGGVNYMYNIGAFEVTAGQYTEFLNAVADDDTYGLYNTDMFNFWAPGKGCKIRRTGSSGSYVYLVEADTDGVEDADWVDRPVNHVSWGDAVRFANWLHNGQPTGAQGPGTTEDGSYVLNGAMSSAELGEVVREADATWVIPSEDEWYKAAYHKNDGVTVNYFDYPTNSDSVPGYVDDSGNLYPDGTLFTEGGTDPGNYATYDVDGGIWSIGSPYYRTEFGEWENSGSPYGTFDQGGNVWEWNETLIFASFRGRRGGSFQPEAVGGEYMHAGRRDWDGPTIERHHIGFRVAEVLQYGACNLPNQTCGTHLTQEDCEALSGTYEGDGTWCSCSTELPVPAVSAWGLVVLALLTLTAGSIVLTRRRTCVGRIAA